MSFLDPQVRRALIPRWREHRTTAALGELDSVEVERRGPVLDRSFLIEKVDDWLENNDLGSAADLLAASAVFGPVDQTRAAAQFVVSAHRTDLPDLRQLADHFLGDPSATIASVELTVNPHEWSVNQAELARERVRRARRMLAANQRDAVALVDMSHAYATMGLVDKAVAAMRSARSLTPANRFVLRSSARLFVHADRPDLAHSVLSGAPNIRNDPWLLASEIALAGLVRGRQENVRAARSLAENDNLTPFSRSELFAALATLEMNAGNHRHAKRLFEQSLQSPTDNAVAQVQWGMRENSGVIVDLGSLKTPRIYEARSQELADAGDWYAAIREMEAWSLDEPFSARPVAALSYVYAVCLRDDLRAIKALQRGLMANPGNTTLLNNLAFSQANIGLVAEATHTLTQLHGVRPAFDPANLATTGLICFRSRQSTVGRKLYLDAISKLEQGKHLRPTALARLMLAREEALAVGKSARSDLEDARQAVLKNSRPEFLEWLKYIESMIGS